MASERAAIMKEAFEAANINIVGGDGAFFDKFVNAVSLGKSVDGFVDNSDSLKKVFGEYLDGEGNLPRELMEAVGKLSTKDFQNLSVSGVLGRLAAGADDDTKAKLQALAERAKELGIDGN